MSGTIIHYVYYRASGGGVQINLLHITNGGLDLLYDYNNGSNEKNICKMVISTGVARCFLMTSSSRITGFTTDGTTTSFISGWMINDDGLYVQNYNYASESDIWLKKIACTGT